MRIQARIDARYASDEFKAARRDLNHRTKDGLTRAGEKVALPDAKHNAAHLRVNGVPVGPTLYVRSTQRTAYLASRMRGKANRAVGLLEFGGVVRTEIKPRKAQALYFGGRQDATPLPRPAFPVAGRVVEHQPHSGRHR
jgi:hypothetical protein